MIEYVGIPFYVQLACLALFCYLVMSSIPKDGETFTLTCSSNFGGFEPHRLTMATQLEHVSCPTAAC